MTCPGPQRIKWQPGARTKVSGHALVSPPKPCCTPYTSPATRANVCVGLALSWAAAAGSHHFLSTYNVASMCSELCVLYLFSPLPQSCRDSVPVTPTFCMRKLRLRISPL